MSAEFFTRAAAVRPSTLTDDGRVDVVLSTGAAVQRRGYIERLGIAPDNVSFAAHVPVLDAHRQTSIRDILGRTENIRFEDGAVVATLHITDANALEAVRDGRVTGVSVGYRVSEWEDAK
ncbi:MAG: DUF2213 domain-containing protein [Acidobacteriota bacterium]